MTFVWDLPEGSRSDRAVTDVSGEAVAKRSLAGVEPGTTVTIDVLAGYNGQSRERSIAVVVE